MGYSLSLEFVIEIGSSLGLSGGCMERKVDSSSVELVRGLVVITVLGADAVAVIEVVARASALISGVR